MCECDSARDIKIPTHLNPEEVDCSDCGTEYKRLGLPLNLINRNFKER